MPDDKFGWAASNEMLVSQCVYCRFKHRGSKTCDAYPDGIPSEIIRNEVDHRESYEGDNGITFEAVEDVDVPELTQLT